MQMPGDLVGAVCGAVCMAAQRGLVVSSTRAPGKQAECQCQKIVGCAACSQSQGVCGKAQ